MNLSTAAGLSSCLSMIKRFPLAQPVSADLILHFPLSIGRRNQGDGSFDFNQDGMLDRAGASTAVVESQCLLEDGTVLVNSDRTFEAISFAGDRINHVNLSMLATVPVSARVMCSSSQAAVFPCSFITGFISGV